MLSAQPYSVVLDNFEGSIDFLLHLVQKDELDIYQVPLRTMISQYLTHLQEEGHDVDDGAEFIGVSATLVWLKSKMLLPKHEQAADSTSEDDVDPQFTIIHQLVDYCRFKEAASTLTQWESEQQGYFQRGAEANDFSRKPLGIEHVSLEEFAQLFQQLLSKTAARKGVVKEEIWRTIDKIQGIRQLLRQRGRLAFCDLFNETQSRNELIVIFLAVLELIKLGEMVISSDQRGQNPHRIDAENVYFECGGSTA